jgi:D-proline reductase (dithiol) PrdB
VQILDVERFRAAYPAWLAAMRPLLEARNWKDAFKTYPYAVNTESPWTPLGKPVAQCRIAVLTTAGLYLAGAQPPFRATDIEGDWTVRELPGDVTVERIAIAHDHYDPARARADLNCVFPIDRLREMVDDGLIGELADVHYSISGYCTRADQVAEHTAPQVVARARQDRVDALLHIPV